MGRSYPIYACNSNHARYSSVHVTFYDGSKRSLLKNTTEKTWQVESVKHTGKYHIKFLETFHYLKDLKRRGRIVKRS